jgi:hypothetical protein
LKRPGHTGKLAFGDIFERDGRDEYPVRRWGRCPRVALNFGKQKTRQSAIALGTRAAATRSDVLPSSIGIIVAANLDKDLNSHLNSPLFALFADRHGNQRFRYF